jgi:hypothetical protein
MNTNKIKGANNKILKYYVMPTTIAANIGIGILIGYLLNKHGIERGFVYGALIGFFLALADLIAWSILVFRETKK